MNRKLEIRSVIRKDIPGILEIYSPFVSNTAVSFETEIPSENEMWERASGILKELPFFVCLVDGVVTGYAYASNHRSRKAYQWSKEVSVYVHPDFRGKKIASVLYSVLFKILKFQGVTNLLAGITLPNKKSVLFHEKMGFKKIGEFQSVGYKSNKWHNVGWWERNLNIENLPPNKKLIPFEEIKNADFVHQEILVAERGIIL